MLRPRTIFQSTLSALSIILLIGILIVYFNSIPTQHLSQSAFDTGLVAAYSFDEGAGDTLTDVSAGENTGTIHGAQWSRTGKYGGALYFDGIDDYVAIPDTQALEITNSITIAAWVYPLNNSGWRSIVHKINANKLDYGLYSSTEQNTPGGFVYTTTENAAMGRDTIPNLAWTHLASTYDGVALRLYVNGNLIQTTPVTGNINVSQGNFFVGGSALWGDYFQGRIDEVRIYDQALDEHAIDRITHKPLGEPAEIMPANFVAAYAFENIEGTSVIDATGKGHNGTIAGATLTAHGYYGQAMVFDGVDDIITIPDDRSLDLNTEFTIAAWISPTLLGGWQKILSKGHNAESAYTLYASTDDGLPAAELTLVSGAVQSKGATRLPLATWTYIAMTYDGALLTLFINGKPVRAVPTAGTMRSSAGQLQIGGDAQSGDYFAGIIDEVSLYNRAFQDEAVAILAHVAIGKLPTSSPDDPYPSQPNSRSSGAISPPPTSIATPTSVYRSADTAYEQAVYIPIIITSAPAQSIQRPVKHADTFYVREDWDTLVTFNGQQRTLAYIAGFNAEVNDPRIFDGSVISKIILAFGTQVIIEFSS